MNKEKNIPKLRFSEFTGEWEIKKLGEIGKFIGGGTPSTQNYNFWNGNIPWISSSDLSEESIYQINTTRFITSEAVSQSATKIIPKQSILIVSRVGVGKIAVNEDEICTSQDFTNLIVNFDNYKFLAYLIKFKTNKLLELNQGTSIKGFVKSDLEVLQIELPSFTEQTKIASFLTSVDEKLQALKKKKSLLEQYKKGVMQQIFSQEIRFKDDNGNDFPEWEEKYGNFIFESISDKNHNSDLPILAITQEFGAIPRDLIDFNISVMDKSIDGYKVVQNGDYIISLRSFQGGIEYSNYHGICSPAYIILRQKIGINKMFYKYYFKTDYYIKLLQKNLEGIRDGKMISYKYFSEIPLPYPSIPEQTKIANFLSAIDEKINNCSGQIEKTELWKKGLLQQMFV